MAYNKKINKIQRDVEITLKEIEELMVTDIYFGENPKIICIMRAVAAIKEFRESLETFIQTIGKLQL